MVRAFLFALVATGFSLSAIADAPQIDQISKSDLRKVGNEFAANFSHTAVAAPETEGIWGVEVGLIAGITKSPKFSDVVDQAGGTGSDFKNIYTAGLMARAHFPYNLFVEATALPSRDISDVTVKNGTLGLGWNAGASFGLPLDLAVGVDVSNSTVQFDQVINNTSTGNTDVNSQINLKSKTRVLWVGISKKFLFLTPYAKVGAYRSESDVTVDATTGTIFGFSNSQSESVSTTGSYAAVGANLQFFLFRLGIEGSTSASVQRVAAKLSLAF